MLVARDEIKESGRKYCEAGIAFWIVIALPWEESSLENQIRAILGRGERVLNFNTISYVGGGG